MSAFMWRCYSTRADGSYSYRSVGAVDFNDARLRYEIEGSHTFVWAEPLADSVRNVGQSPSSAAIKARLEQMLVGSDMGRVKVEHVANLKPVPGPRKPIPAIPPEVHHVAAFDPVKAWEATIAASKGV